MTPLTSLIFGLGLFFLGLRLVGDNLRSLVGSKFRAIIKGTTQSPALGAGLGLAAGALMQSATAVTFILVSMTGSGLIKPPAAAPIIIWCNVGLTVLAFVATLNIHPYVALIVGGAGIVMGTIRKAQWQTTAGAVLGMGLILIGLEQMSAGAAPLKDAPWFRHAISVAVANPAAAFVTGVAAAAILQSNTGAAMLVITLAAGGLIGLKPAMLLIYGTNLGAIGLRIFLSTGLRGEQMRLVRLEDLFCVISAVIMLGLYALEATGIPLVAAGTGNLPFELTTKLAVVFLLSNLIPALAMSPILGPCRKLLLKFWPDKPHQDAPSDPLYIRSQALNDPPTALDLMGKELAHLLELIRIEPGDEEDDAAPEDFQKLSETIEDFAAKLASRNTISEEVAHTLHLRRAELSMVRHIEESVRYYARASNRNTGPALLDRTLEELMALAIKASSAERPEDIAELSEKTKLKGSYFADLQKQASINPGSPLGAVASFEDFTVVAWMLRRLAKLLARLKVSP